MPELTEYDEQATPADTTPPLPIRPPIVPPAAAVPPPAPPVNPIDQAQQAVATATKFQGMRGYQRDLEAGKSPAEALAKWAPVMFGGGGASPQSTFQDAMRLPTTTPRIGPVVSPPAPVGPPNRWVNAAQPPIIPPTGIGPRPMPPTAAPGVVRDVNGQLVRLNADGSVTALTPPKAGSANRFDVKDYEALADDIKQAKKEFYDADSPNFKTADQRLKIQNLQKQADEIRNRVVPPSGIPMQPPAPSASSQKTRIRVKSKDGKIGTIPFDKLDDALAKGYTRA